MISWIVYFLIVSGLLTLTAWILNSLFQRRQLPVRWVWLAAMCASLLVPLVAARTEESRVIRPYDLAVGIPITQPLILQKSWANWIDLEAKPWTQVRAPRSDQWIRTLWVTGSILVFGWTAATMAFMRARRKSWRKSRLQGVDVRVSEKFGPAVIGIFRPEIVIPAWVLRMPSATQKLILAHEQSHVNARDPRLLAVGLCLVALAPWNPLLWWQLYRLRLAIEVDCDRRVLRTGVNCSAYASTLVDCSVRRQTLLVVSAAMAEPASTLKRRIALMTSTRITRWGTTAVLGILCAGVTAIAATQLEPPRKVPEPDSALQQFVGDYEFASVTVLKITSRNDHLEASFGDGPADELIDQGRDSYRANSVDASFTFSRDATGHIKSAVLHQNGADTVAPRIGTVRVAQIRAAIEAHIGSHQPATGSEAALRQLIAGIRSGAPDYTKMSAQLAGGTRAMLKDFQGALNHLGSVRSASFLGVSPDGWDQYLVQHDRGSSTWSIALDDRSTIVGALWHVGG